MQLTELRLKEITMNWLTRIVNLNIKLIQHGIQVFLIPAPLLPRRIQQLEAIIPATQRNTLFDGNVVPINLRLIPIRSAIEQRHSQFGPGAFHSGLFPDQVFEVSRSVRPLGVGAEAHLNRRQNG
jgi:hypothetical protein